MPTALIGGAISGGASIISGLLGSGAANKAAQQEQAANAQAASQTAAAAGQSATGITNAVNQAQQNYAPYTAAGTQSVNSLANLLAPGGQLTQGYAQSGAGTFQAPTAAQAQATPGYQFQLQQGEQALQNSAAASGGLLSTGTAKNLTNYAEGLASTNYQNTYNNALNAYNENFNVYNTSQNNLYSRLAGLTNTGLSAAGSLSNAQLGGANSLANVNMGAAQQIGGYLTGSGQAAAAGTVGSANALSNGISGGLNALGQGVTLSGLIGAQNASNANTSQLSMGPNGQWVPITAPPPSVFSGTAP